MPLPEKQKSQDDQNFSKRTGFLKVDFNDDLEIRSEEMHAKPKRMHPKEEDLEMVYLKVGKSKIFVYLLSW